MARICINQYKLGGNSIQCCIFTPKKVWINIVNLNINFSYYVYNNSIEIF